MIYAMNGPQNNTPACNVWIKTMTIHIGAKTGDIAETVLLPGDPYRARWAAQS